MNRAAAYVVCTGRGTHPRAILEVGIPHNDGRRPAQVMACPQCRRQWQLGRKRMDELQRARYEVAEIDLSWW